VLRLRNLSLCKREKKNQGQETGGRGKNLDAPFPAPPNRKKREKIRKIHSRRDKKKKNRRGVQRIRWHDSSERGEGGGGAN